MIRTSNLAARSTPIAQLGDEAKSPPLGDEPKSPPKELSKARIGAALGLLRDTTMVGGQAEDEWSTSTNRVSRDAARGFVFRMRPIRSRLDSFVTEQRWQGYVTAVREETFDAILLDVFGDSEEIEVAELRIDEVTQQFRYLIQPGAIFFWDIGFLDDSSGQRARQSIFSFPMIPVWSADQIAEQRANAEARFKELGWTAQAQTPASGRNESRS